MRYKIFCDETCHLESDKNKFMVLGAVYCPVSEINNINKYIRKLKLEHGLKETAEIKWGKISNSKLEFYKDLINFFFLNNSIRFRAIVCDKDILNHEKFCQTHDEWYHKMYYGMIRYIISNENSYEIYPDIKDTNSYRNFQNVLGFLRIAMHDSNAKTIIKIQPIRSNESYLLQLSDVLIGAIQYHKNNKKTSRAKLEIVNLIQSYVTEELGTTTPFNKTKFNTLEWVPYERFV